MKIVRKAWSFSWFASVLLAAGASTAAQQARSPFDAATVVLPREEAPFRRMLDVDLDGDLDALAVQFASTRDAYRFATYRNDGSGGFTKVYSGTGSVTQADDLLVEVGRLNDDAYPDFCIVCGTTRHDYLGNPFIFGGFASQPPIALPSEAKKMALAELDGDGISDLVWLDNAKLHVFTSSGAQAEIATAPLGTEFGLRVLPRNGPSSSDVFLTLISDDVQIFYGSPSGLVAGPVFDTNLDQSMLQAGDIDGDGDIDAIVFQGGTTAHYRVLRRSAPASWTLEPIQAGGPAEFLADVDGDGDLDGVCCGGGGGGGGNQWPDNVLPSEFQVSINDGSGGFAPTFKIQGVGSPQLAGAVDVDGDGDVDLVAGRCVYYADGPLRPPHQEDVAPFWRGSRDLSDCDGDGDTDVGFSTESVHSNDGSGRFTLETPLILPAPAGTRYAGLGLPGDFDGDGDIDLLVELRRDSKAQTAAASSTHQVAPVRMVLLGNDGAGDLTTLLPASDVGVSFTLDNLEAEASLLSDVDLDGDLDLVTRTLGRITRPVGAQLASRLWINRGPGYFDAGKRFPDIRSEWAGDFDLDGDTDLVTSQQTASGESEIGLYLGTPASNGMPRFDSYSSVSFPFYTFDPFGEGFAVGDYVPDGYPDFAITLNSFFDVVGFINTTAYGGTLVATASLDNNYQTGVLDMRPDSRVSLGDLNGDGLDDALVGVHAGEQVDISDVVLNVGPFQFVQQLVPPGLLVDLDTDGDLDLLGRSKIVFNRTVP